MFFFVSHCDTELKEIVLKEGHNGGAGGKSGERAAGAGDVEVRVLQRLLRAEPVVLHARGQNHERRRSLVTSRRLGRRFIIALKLV